MCNPLLTLHLYEARSFYSAVFNWSFREHDAVTGFAFPEQKLSSLSGGFKKYDQVGGGGAAPRLFFYVSDLEKSMEVRLLPLSGRFGEDFCLVEDAYLVEAIVANGGKKLSDVEPESDFGLMMFAEDTEGNKLGIYTMKNKE